MLLEDEVAQGVAYTLLAEQGADARFTLPEQQKWIDDGHDTGFLIKVFEHLERLRDEKGIKISRQRLTELGLIDEYRIYLHPEILGHGTPFFAGERPPLQLAINEQIDDNVIRLSYVA